MISLQAVGNWASQGAWDVILCCFIALFLLTETYNITVTYQLLTQLLQQILWETTDPFTVLGQKLGLTVKGK